MSPTAWAAHRKAIEAAARHDDDAAIDRECQAIRVLVARLELAARVGSREARQRLKALRHNPVGRAAADAAECALQRLDQLKGPNK